MEVLFPAYMRPDQYEPSESIIEQDYEPRMKNAFRMTGQIRSLQALARKNIAQSREPGNHIILYRDANPQSQCQQLWSKLRDSG